MLSLGFECVHSFFIYSPTSVGICFHLQIQCLSIHFLWFSGLESYANEVQTEAPHIHGAVGKRRSQGVKERERGG